MSRANKTRYIEWHETLSVNVDQMAVFVLINNNVGIKINADVNAKN